MAPRLEASWVLEALNQALGHRKIEPGKLLIHTDQDSQYRASAYRQKLEIHKISPNMTAEDHPLTTTLDTITLAPTGDRR